MAKLTAFLFIAMMAVHIIKPIGWPGLKSRRDVWKLAILAMLAMGATIALREISGS